QEIHCPCCGFIYSIRRGGAAPLRNQGTHGRWSCRVNQYDYLRTEGRATNRVVPWRRKKSVPFARPTLRATCPIASIHLPAAWVIGGDAGNDVPLPPRSSSASEQVERLAKAADVIVHSTIHPIMGPDKGSGFFPHAYFRQSNAFDLSAMAKRAGAKFGTAGAFQDSRRATNRGGLS